MASILLSTAYNYTWAELANFQVVIAELMHKLYKLSKTPTSRVQERYLIYLTFGDGYIKGVT